MKIKLRYILLSFALAIAGAGLWRPHGGAEETGSAPATSSTVAPEATLAASDTISRYIDMNYPQPQTFNLALNQYAQAELRFINESATPDQAYTNHLAVGRSIDCVFYVARVYAKEETNWAINAIDRVSSVITASPAARDRLAGAQKLLGMRFYKGVPVAQEAQTCDFPVSTPEMEAVPQESEEDA